MALAQTLMMLPHSWSTAHKQQAGQKLKLANSHCRTSRMCQPKYFDMQLVKFTKGNTINVLLASLPT